MNTPAYDKLTAADKVTCADMLAAALNAMAYDRGRHLTKLGPREAALLEALAQYVESEA